MISTKRHILVLVLATCLLALSSCKLGKSYVRPDLHVPDKYQPLAADSLTLADMHWWEIYGDTLLQGLIRTALEHNKDLLQSEAKLREMAARKRIALAGLFPSISGNAYAQKEGLNYGGDHFTSDPEQGVKFIATWELDIWGNQRWLRDESIALWLAAQENQRALQLTIIADVAEAYFELVALDYELAMVRQTLGARAEGVRLAKLRYEGGLTSETSYQQAQVEYARTATHIPTLELAIEKKQNELSYLTGSYPSELERAAFLGDGAWNDTIPAHLSSLLIERRPDIRAAEQTLIAANAAVGVAYTNRFPRIALTAQGGVESDQLSTLLKSPMYFMSAAITGPVFDMGKRQAQYRAQQALYEQQTYAYEKAVLAAFRDASDALSEFGKSKDIYRAQCLLRESAKATTELAQLQYINGVINYLDLLDAQRSYFDAQIGVINAERDKRIALVHLYKSLGGGWQ